jgi:DNA modification methylase
VEGHGMERPEIKYLPINELVINPDNPRLIRDVGYKRLVKSLKDCPELFDVRPCICSNRTGQNVILGGNMRYMAAKELKYKKVPTIIMDGLTPEQEREITIKDNGTEFGEWNLDLLSATWDDLPLVDWGVSLPEDWLTPETGEPADAEPQIDKAEELNKVWKVKTGDLWQIGAHRLLCGDSTKVDDVARVMGGEKAEFCFTSPPYGQQRDYTGDTKEKVADWDGLMCGVFGNLPMSDDAQVFVNLGLIHHDGEWTPYWDGWIEWMRGQGWRRFGWYVWDQGPGLPGDWNGRFAPSHEFVFHFNREAVRAGKTIPCKHAREKKYGRGLRGKDGTVEDYTHVGRDVQSVRIPDSVIRVMREKFNTGIQALTAAPFPIALPTTFLECWPGIVYEPFLGSGTTMVACQNLNRKCRGIEISESYCAVILERMTDAFPDIEIKRL